MLSPSARRTEILSIMNMRRHEKIAKLASEFGVDRRTIRRDIEILSIYSPLYTVTGRYGGGVYVTSGCYIEMRYLSITQTAFLIRIEKTLDVDDQAILQSIIKDFTIQEKGERRL